MGRPCRLRHLDPPADVMHDYQNQDLPWLSPCPPTRGDVTVVSIPAPVGEMTEGSADIARAGDVRCAGFNHACSLGTATAQACTALLHGLDGFSPRRRLCEKYLWIFHPFSAFAPTNPYSTRMAHQTVMVDALSR